MFGYCTDWLYFCWICVVCASILVFNIIVRSYVSIDVLHRIITDYFNINIVHVMGMTDIDDKIIKKANESKSDFLSVARYFEADFLDDLEKLGVRLHWIFFVISHSGFLNKCFFGLGFL